MTLRAFCLGAAAVLVVLGCRDITAPHPQNPAVLVPRRYLNPAGTVVVSPASMHGWLFYDDQHDSTCGDATVCRLVGGPGTPPLGSGSAELAVASAGDGKALLLPDYGGTRFDQISDLHYATYRQTTDPGSNLAISLQVNVDYDLTDTASSWQGRLVYEPYLGVGGNVQQNTWQSWDARAGLWWGTKTTVWKNGAPVANPCVQASPCSWSRLLGLFPDLGIHPKYGAIVLKAGSGWPAFRGNVDAVVIAVGGVATTFDFEASSVAAVPALPPDSTPTALFDSLGTVWSPTGHGVPWVRGIVGIVFQDGSSQEDRQAAVQAIGGSVVGGHPWPADDGDYYVRIADTSFDGILTTLRTLRRLPQVDYAHPQMIDTLDQAAYLKPHDGTGWQDWRLNPAQTDASRFNWPLEAVSAPAAWGCSTGDSLTEIAVVDQGLIQSPAIAGNVAYSQIITPGLPPSLYRDHGTEVAELLGAVGNDGQMSTGMMWRAKLALWDIFVNPVDPSQTVTPRNGRDITSLIGLYVYLAGARGARVINLSQSEQWTGIAPSESDPADTVRREYAHSVLRRALRLLHNSPVGAREPLVVVAAGNDALDAKWAGYPEVKNEYPDQVLVVGASTASGAIWSQSNVGPLVDVYAPGAGVWVFGRRSTPYQESGSSFAAPLASGVAGLLTGFDSRLTTSQLRSFIINGARTPLSASGSRLLDAYGALHQAALRPGAPLCGNQPVWAAGGTLYVRRDSVSMPEALASIGSDAWDVDVYHGGKWIDYQTDGAFGHVKFTGSGWSSTPDWDTSDLPGGAYASTHGTAHDWNAAVSGQALVGDPRWNTISPDSERVTVYVSDTLGNVDSTMITFGAGTASQPRRTWAIPVAYPQRGDTALVAITRVRGQVRDSTFGCVDDRGVPATCHDVSTTWDPDTTFLYAVRVDAGGPQLVSVRQLPDTLIYWMAFSDDDRSTIVGIGREHDVTSGNGNRTVSWCELQVRDSGLATTQNVWSSSSDACPSFSYGAVGVGSFTPNRLPAAHGGAYPRLNILPEYRRQGGAKRR